VQLFGVDEASTTDRISDYLNGIADKYPDYLLFYDLHNSSSLPCHNAISSHIQKRGITVRLFDNGHPLYRAFTSKVI
jgi:hypothetical protein